MKSKHQDQQTGFYSFKNSLLILVFITYTDWMGVYVFNKDNV